MTTYKQISGTTVQSNAGTLENAAEGQLWYDSTNKDFKYSYGATSLVGSWATGGNLNTARSYLAGVGTQTATLAFGGRITPNPATAVTELYNGTSWTELNDLNTARYGIAGAGADSTSALAFGGDNGSEIGNTESWNGTSWTEVNDLNQGRAKMAASGIQTAALAFGGKTASDLAVTESWNGTSWTEVNDLGTARYSHGGAGTQTSALAFGGKANPLSPQIRGETESWNGTNWTEVNDLNFARNDLGGTGASNTSAIAFGGDGDPPRYAKTELWDGTSWSSTGDMNNATDINAGSGTKTSALNFGGRNPGSSPGYAATTEEFTAAPAAVGAWSTGGSLNTARTLIGDAGTQTAALAFGGQGPTTRTETYDGTSWTEVNDMNIESVAWAGAGTQTSALAFGATSPSTESWNGTS